jgi:iron(III) transport system permease protein
LGTPVAKVVASVADSNFRSAGIWRRIDAWPCLFLAVVVVASAIILTFLAVVIWLSFREGAIGDPDAAASLANYADVFFDSFTYRVIANTFGFSFVALIVALAFGLPVAWLAERTDFPGKTLIFTLMAIGLLVPGFAAAMGWLFLMHPRMGLVNVWLMNAFGLSRPPFNISSIAGMGWVQGLSLAPLAFIMTAAVFRSMDPSLEESAQMSGAGFLNVLRRITLPIAWPGILAASIYIFTLGFAAFDVPAIIGWGSRLFTFTSYLLVQLTPDASLPRYGPAAALSSFLIGFAAVFSWWYSRMQSRAHRYKVVTGKAYRPILVKLSRRGKLMAWLFVGCYVSLSKLLPILVLCWASILPFFQLPSAAALRRASLARFANLPWDHLLSGLRNTLLLMVLTPTITLLLSVCFSWVVLRSRVPGRSWFDFIAFLPHAVPNIVFGIGALLFALFIVQDAIPLYGTIWLMLLVFVVARTSYGTRMTNSGLIQIHRELEESGSMNGAGTGAVLREIVLPLLGPTLLYAWLWIALLTARELTLAVILTSRDSVTLPVVVWGLWLGGGTGDAAAVALLMLILMAPFIALYWVVARRRILIAGS